jgi:phage-related protein
MPAPPARLPVLFYRTKSGSEPVRDWLRGLVEDERRRIGSDLHRVQTQWPVGMPLCRSLGGGLWEMRSSLPGNRIARLLFVIHRARIGVVHGFIKKTQKTSADDINFARARMKEMMQ